MARGKGRLAEGGHTEEAERDGAEEEDGAVTGLATGGDGPADGGIAVL